MELTLNRDDLKPRYQDLNASQTTFSCFRKPVQDVIRLVGKARFESHGNYNVIYPLKQS